jgi:hypothetical protein
MKALTPYDSDKPKQRKQKQGALRSFVLPLTSGMALTPFGSTDPNHLI